MESVNHRMLENHYFKEKNSYDEELINWVGGKGMFRYWEKKNNKKSNSSPPEISGRLMIFLVSIGMVRRALLKNK